MLIKYKKQDKTGRNSNLFGLVNISYLQVRKNETHFNNSSLDVLTSINILKNICIMQLISTVTPFDFSAQDIKELLSVFISSLATSPVGCSAGSLHKCKILELYT